MGANLIGRAYTTLGARGSGYCHAVVKCPVTWVPTFVNGGHEACSSGFRRARKYAGYGVVRTIPPSQTIRQVLPLMETVGVTRIADITGLDSIGIPNFTTVRPRESGEGISYYTQGRHSRGAKAGALMEAIERYSGEFCDHRVYCTRAEIGRSGPTVDPAEILVPTLVSYQPDQALEWVEGFDLISDTATFVPLNLVICPYSAAGRPRIFYESTNGLASGNAGRGTVPRPLRSHRTGRDSGRGRVTGSGPGGGPGPGPAQRESSGRVRRDLRAGPSAY